MSEEVTDELMSRPDNIIEQGIANQCGMELAGHEITSPSKTSQEARQLEIESISKDDPRISAADGNKFKRLREIDTTIFVPNTLNVIVSGKSIVVTGIKEVQNDENENAYSKTPLEVNIPEQFNSDKVEAWLDSDNNFLYLYAPPKNEPVANV